MITEINQSREYTTAKETPESFLEKAKDWDMDRCVVVGFDENGSLRCGASFSEIGEMLIMLELTKQRLLEGLGQ